MGQKRFFDSCVTNSFTRTIQFPLQIFKNPAREVKGDKGGFGITDFRNHRRSSGTPLVGTPLGEFSSDMLPEETETPLNMVTTMVIVLNFL